MNTSNHGQISEQEFINVVESEYLVISRDNERGLPYVYIYKNEHAKKPLVKVNLGGFLEIVHAYMGQVSSK